MTELEQYKQRNAELDMELAEARRDLAQAQGTILKNRVWLEQAKRDAGYPDNISFDVVWHDALRALKASKETTGKGGQRIVPFELADEGNKEATVGGKIEINTFGISLIFNGYSDCASIDDEGVPVFVEYYDGKLRALIYADINSEEPTQVIDLAGARNDKRILEKNEA